MVYNWPNASQQELGNLGGKKVKAFHNRLENNLQND
jgi:hypothetical protein